MSDDGVEPTAAPVSVSQRRAVAAQRRREILGDEYVNATSGDDSPGARAMRDYVLDSAWSVWTRPGLALRDRSLLVLAMTAATGRMDEFAIHCRSAPRAGVTPDEIDELVLQVAAYCGVPAGVAARRVVAATRGAATPVQYGEVHTK
ncbi:carboxymuconolactone decarboxylase family protein [Streptomyces sp. NPDC001982]|uniref:carboxymuconolactone decarboxylase family protein n=1 Tax=unclassified Streptomyces TaxID=2593676 RepID=UPI00332EE10A